MDKTVAEALWQVATRRQHLEYLKWVHMPNARPEQIEAQRQRVAAWATAANELYDQAKQEPITKEN